MKKTYTKPEIEISLFAITDIIQTSEEPAVMRLKTVVNGNEGLDFGSGDVSLLD